MRAWLLVLAAFGTSGCTIQSFMRSNADPARSRLSSLPPNVVPPSGRVEQVWSVPPGTGAREVVVGWSYRGRHVPGTLTDRRYVLTVWRLGAGGWTSTTLFRRSPFPFQPTSVRTADVTGDGHRDLLVTVECNGCNHAVATAAVYADVGRRMRRIYGSGFLDGSKGQGIGVPGLNIVETAWGAWRGLVWLDEPHYGPRSSMCCPEYRIQTFLRWDGDRWRVVSKRKVSSGRDTYLGQRPVPAP